MPPKAVAEDGCTVNKHGCDHDADHVHQPSRVESSNNVVDDVKSQQNDQDERRDGQQLNFVHLNTPYVTAAARFGLICSVPEQLSSELFI